MIAYHSGRGYDVNIWLGTKEYSVLYRVIISAHVVARI